jgi:hypothetical protein
VTELKIRKRAFNQNRDWLESISSPETRRRGMLAMLHGLGKHHDPAGCPRCEEENKEIDYQGLISDKI